jgi:hypothetical protein
MLNLLFPEVRRFARAARQHYDVAVGLIAVQVQSGGGASIEAYHAVYIGGYAVECALKALYLSRVQKARHRLVIEEKLKDLAHNLDGCCDSLRESFDVVMPLSLRTAFRTEVLPAWRVDMRYVPGRKQVADARRFLAVVRDILAWTGVE